MPNLGVKLLIMKAPFMIFTVVFLFFTTLSKGQILLCAGLHVVASIDSPECGSSIATITATGIGGTKPYLYSISVNQFQSSNIFHVTTGDFYQLQIKDSNNCGYDTVLSVKANSVPYNNWVGSSDNVWENPINWSCGFIPDSLSNVVINSGTVILNSNVTVNSLKVNPSAVLTVNSGFNLIVLH